MQASVVVIDDDSDAAEVFSELLSIKGMNVLGVGSNGRDAVNLYKKHKPDIVLMDMLMPNYDGFYGINKIRETDPGAKIIIITVDVSASTRKRLAEHKVSATIYKPYNIDTLTDLINSLQKGETAVMSHPTD